MCTALAGYLKPKEKRENSNDTPPPLLANFEPNSKILMSTLTLALYTLFYFFDTLTQSVLYKRVIINNNYK